MKELTSAARPTPVEGSESPEEPDFGFDEELFEGGKERQHLSRRQKRRHRHQHCSDAPIRDFNRYSDNRLFMADIGRYR